MVSFDLSFRSMLIEEIVEDEGAIWTDRSISWLSVNRGSSQDKRIQVVYGELFPCIDVFSGAVYRWGRHLKRLVAFSSFLSNKSQKPKIRPACRHNFFLKLTIRIVNYSRGLHILLRKDSYYINNDE